MEECCGLSQPASHRVAQLCATHHRLPKAVPSYLSDASSNTFSKLTLVRQFLLESPHWNPSISTCYRVLPAGTPHPLPKFSSPGLGCPSLGCSFLYNFGYLAFSTTLNPPGLLVWLSPLPLPPFAQDHVRFGLSQVSLALAPHVYSKPHPPYLRVVMSLPSLYISFFHLFQTS